MANAKSKAREEVKGKARESEETVREYTEDSIEISRELTKQVRDSYLTSLKLGLSLWENNLKMINDVVGQWLSIRQEVYTSLYDVFTPKNGDPDFGRSLIERTFSIHRQYLDRIRDLSERGVQEAERELKENL
ncbi:MAG TPA: hypothetical protein VLB01_05465 [Thermodesulfobacteriota bacterium]|nr:hypothetical protein [Thermodesulfobacteriota bacterium]